MPFERFIEIRRNRREWNRANYEDVGFGTAGVCPTCHTPNAHLLAGWYNAIAGTGKAMFRCHTCKRSWTWARKPKAVMA